ncbi:Alcohol acetyltransferase [Colletotrichum tropicale]|nr:Alcohol acetyltransferase [Colletotrichum tropicale]
MRGNILACRYRFPSQLSTRESHRDLVETFERAVARVVLKHPQLHVGIAGGSTARPYWVRLDNVKLDEHIDWRLVEGEADDHLREAFVRVAYEQLDTEFSNHETTPGWRLVVLRRAGVNSIEVLLVFDHTILDGGSAKTFHRDLLQSLQEDAQSTDDQDAGLKDHVLMLPGDSTATFSPPPEDVVRFPVTADPTAADEASIGHARNPADAHWAPIATAPFKSQFRTIAVPLTLLSQLVQSCRQHQVTLTGLLHALTLVSLAPLLGPAESSAFTSMTAMDLRRFLPSDQAERPWFKPEEAMSNYVTILNHVFDEDLVAKVRSRGTSSSSAGFGSAGITDLVWSAAGRVRRDIAAKLDQGTTDDMIGFALAVDDWRAYLIESTRRPRPASWVITNLGVVDSRPDMPSAPDPRSHPSGSDTGPEAFWSITQSECVMCANVVSAAFGISMTAVQGGDLIINITWQDCVVSAELGEAFVANLQRWLTSGEVLALRRLGAEWEHRL